MRTACHQTGAGAGAAPQRHRAGKRRLFAPCARPAPIGAWSLAAFAAFLLPVLLAACAGPVARSPEATARGVETGRAPARQPRKTTVVQKKGGAYYKDDGPGDEIPDNLDELPDAVPKAEALHRFANRPYVVLGKAYEPFTALRPYQERGVASWYGKKFHGQKTSIGEPYDMFSMTAAHPTLALPSYARVTNLGNGRSVVVRVTDRGPFHADRVIDLSYAAAYRLGYVDDGSTLVQVESIVPEGATTMTYAQVMPAPRVLAAQGSSAPDEIELLVARLGQEARPAYPLASGMASQAPPADAGGSPASLARGVFLQLGAFSSIENAESLRAHLQRELDWLGEAIQVNPGGGIHRVHLGPYASRGDAEKVAERIRLALGYRPTFVSR